MSKRIADHSVMVEDDIDLFLLFKKTWIVAKEYGLLFLLITIMGITLGIIHYYVQSPTFKARMIANSELLKNSEAIGIVSTWQELLIKGERGVLAQKLGVGSSVISQLYSIEAQDDEPASADGFVIEVLIGDNKILGDLQNAIVRSLENNAYVKKRVELKKRTLLNTKQEILNEINALKQSRSAVKGMLENGEKPAGSLIIDPGTINVQIIELSEKLFKTEESLELIDDFQIIEGFTASNVPDSPKKGKSMIIGGLFGVITAIIVISLIIIGKKIRSLSV